ncbi:hypothetical protein ACFPZL_01460 [Leucobacter soli]|uniref:hypothetical protein n=2 Tax=Leucobacter soli TaxID=2812850 RepID=UPI001C407B60|nr:hypothetical protein [Leucobacter soli]
MLALLASVGLACFGAALPAQADESVTISGVIQFPAKSAPPYDIEGNLIEFGDFGADDEVTRYEIFVHTLIGVVDPQADLAWDAATKRLRWSFAGAADGHYTLSVDWTHYAHVNDWEAEQQTLWLSGAGTRLSADPRDPGVFSASTGTGFFHCAYGNESCMGAGAPKVSGAAKVGKRLTVAPGAWLPAEEDGAAVEYSYLIQWLRNGVAIPGATRASYTPVAADAGKQLSARVLGAAEGLKSATAVSAAKTIAKGTLSAPKPRISGTAKVGKKLTAKPGTWKPAGVKRSYRWYANGVKIPGATKSTYTVAKKYAGKRITVAVTGTKSGYVKLSKTSASKRVAK